MSGWIKLHSKMLDWEWYDSLPTKVLFIHLLLKANWREARWHGLTIKPGQLVTSTAKLAEETGLTYRQIRYAIKTLESCHSIVRQTTNKYSLITIENYTFYQCADSKDELTVADEWQTNGKQMATIEEYKTNRLKEKVSKDTQKKSGIDSVIEALPDEVKDVVRDFIQHRKEIKKPLTKRALELTVKKANELSGGDTARFIAVLEQSITNGWVGVFPLNEDSTKARKETQADKYYKLMKEYDPPCRDGNQITKRNKQ